jgi:fibronectin type 3 domain-containing protein
MDTSAPEKVSGLRARGFRDKVEVSWESMRDVPDLAGYRVMRSEQPLNGYQQIARTELNTYEDRSAKPDVVHYYRVFALDRAGNESEFSATVNARLATRELSLLTGEVARDTFLSGIYVLKGQFSVPRGVTLGGKVGGACHRRRASDDEGRPIERRPDGPDVEGRPRGRRKRFGYRQ